MFLGSRSAEHLPALYNLSDVFVMPNRTPEENVRRGGIRHRLS